MSCVTAASVTWAGPAVTGQLTHQSALMTGPKPTSTARWHDDTAVQQATILPLTRLSVDTAPLVAATTLRTMGKVCVAVRRRAAGSASSVDDQYVDLGLGGDTSGDRENPPDERGSRAQSHIADH